MNQIKRTERGWAGHFICADRCRFRRNTLLEYKELKIVVSSVGLMKSLDEKSFEIIGCNRYYETMAFHANKRNKRYLDIDVHRQINFTSPWTIDKIDVDDKANEMHEKVVEEITEKLLKGKKFTTSY